MWTLPPLPPPWQSRGRFSLSIEEQAGAKPARVLIATVTLNRPDVRNSINGEMLCRLADAWQDINDDPGVRVVILAGSGENASCAGADLDRLVRMMQGLRPAENEAVRRYACRARFPRKAHAVLQGPLSLG